MNKINRASIINLAMCLAISLDVFLVASIWHDGFRFWWWLLGTLSLSFGIFSKDFKSFLISFGLIVFFINTQDNQLSSFFAGFSICVLIDLVFNFFQKKFWHKI